MNFSKTQLVIVAVAGVVVLIFALVFLGVIPGLQSSGDNPQAVKASLKLWGVFDNADAYNDILNNFKNSYPGITVTYRNFGDENGYESSLLDALASGTGPDIFMLPAGDVYKNLNKIVPVSPLKFTLLNLRQIFPQVVEGDAVYKESIYGLPLSIDTLALIYNKDLLNKAAITNPPATWDDFKNIVKPLVQLGEGVNIEQAAAAIGGSEKNIEHASDILNLLMLQTGVPMVTADLRSAAFYISPAAVTALSFYIQFADPKNSSYTWNGSMPNSLEAFEKGKTAMIFDYASSISQIKSANAFLNLSVAPVPQLKSAQKFVAYPDYWVYVVSRQSKNPDAAWDLIKFMTTNSANSKSYLSKTGRPPASLSSINAALDNPELGVFARQAIYASSWHQIEPATVSQIFSQMIESVNGGQATVQSALIQAGEKFNQMLSRHSFQE